MPLRDKSLDEEMVGREFDPAALASGAWHDQGGPGFHYGLPRGKRLWVRRFDPLGHCCHHIIWLFVLLQLDAKNRARSVRTMVCENHLDGGFDELEVPLFPSDQAEARAALLAELEYIVDAYRARWIIEEYFKALKTGCLYEKRQLESAHALLNALAVLVPVAWRLLLLRSLARDEPARPATDALTPTQVAVLQATAKKPLPALPSVRDALLAVAALGGHIRNNGEPGWQVLGRGFRDLLILEMGWQARGGPPRCDQ